MTKRAVAHQMKRFRVYRVTRDLMEYLGRCPTGKEVHDDIPEMSQQTVVNHMRALSGAAGLPYPVEFNSGGADTHTAWGVDRVMAQSSERHMGKDQFVPSRRWSKP